MEQSKIDQIKVYKDFFDRSDYQTVLDKISDAKWQFGHTSYPPGHPRYKYCHSFWKIELHDDEFFTKHLLNKIQEKMDESYICDHVYANGQTYGLDGTLHQDCYDETGRTFLLYANPMWCADWGGLTQFYINEGEFYSVAPEPNKSIIFPGVIYHSSTPTSRLFNGLRVTIAWKLKKK